MVILGRETYIAQGVRIAQVMIHYLEVLELLIVLWHSSSAQAVSPGSSSGAVRLPMSLC